MSKGWIECDFLINFECFWYSGYLLSTDTLIVMLQYCISICFWGLLALILGFINVSLNLELKLKPCLVNHTYSKMILWYWSGRGAWGKGMCSLPPGFLGSPLIRWVSSIHFPHELGWELFHFLLQLPTRKKNHFICLSPKHEYSVIQISSFGALVFHVWCTIKGCVHRWLSINNWRSNNLHIQWSVIGCDILTSNFAWGMLQ